MFDLNIFKILILAVIALVIFGPDRLPTIAAQAGRIVRELRQMAEGAKSQLKENLGPEFSEFGDTFGDFDVRDLNPKHFVRKHLTDELFSNGSSSAPTSDTPANGSNGSGAYAPPSATSPVLTADPLVRLAPGERPPYDVEAT